MLVNNNSGPTLSIAESVPVANRTPLNPSAFDINTNVVSDGSLNNRVQLNPVLDASLRGNIEGVSQTHIGGEDTTSNPKTALQQNAPHPPEPVVVGVSATVRRSIHWETLQKMREAEILRRLNHPDDFISLTPQIVKAVDIDTLKVILKALIQVLTNLYGGESDSQELYSLIREEEELQKLWAIQKPEIQRRKQAAIDAVSKVPPETFETRKQEALTTLHQQITMEWKAANQALLQKLHAKLKLGDHLRGILYSNIACIPIAVLSDRLFPGVLDGITDQITLRCVASCPKQEQVLFKSCYHGSEIRSITSSILDQNLHIVGLPRVTGEIVGYSRLKKYITRSYCKDMIYNAETQGRPAEENFILREASAFSDSNEIAVVTNMPCRFVLTRRAHPGDDKLLLKIDDTPDETGRPLKLMNVLIECNCGQWRAIEDNLKGSPLSKQQTLEELFKKLGVSSSKALQKMSAEGVRKYGAEKASELLKLVCAKKP